MASSLASADDAAVWKFGDVELDEATRELKVCGELVDIEPRPFDLLLLLLRRAGEVVRNEEIITQTWAGHVINDSASKNVSNAVSKLRKLLRDDDHEYIRTSQRIGYKFVAPFEKIPRRGAPEPAVLELDRPVPGRPHWVLSEHLDTSGYGDVWVATNAKTREQRVFKFCTDEVRLSALKRESTLFRMLKEQLGERAPVPTLLEWQFETPPYYLEAERWGRDLRTWVENLGGLSRLSIETRLRIMVLTSEVVAAIHAVGVLHKDLKPRNILVRGDAATLEVRLCDFGAGMLLEGTPLEALDITRLGFTHTVVNAGTPTYLAPEILAGGMPSIQSDVYSLGVLLYQLAVSDWRPVAFGWENDVADELLREDIALCIDRDPDVRPPSASIIAQRLGALPERLKQREDNRLAEERSRALAESLERAQARRPWMIAAASILIVAAVVSSVLTLRSRRAAELAVENERVARAVADFLVNDIVRQSSPDYGGHVDVTLKAAMLNSVPKISERLSGPVAAELNQSLAEILASLSAPGEAAGLARTSAGIYARLYGADDRRALSAKMDELNYRRLLEPGPALIRELEAITPALSRLPDTDTVSVKAAMAKAWLATYVEGRVEESLPALGRIVSTLEDTPSKETDQARQMYIKHLVLAGRYEAADDAIRRLLPDFERRYGSDSGPTLELHRMLGRTLEAERASTHDFAGAEREYQLVIQGLTSLYGPDSSEVNQVRIDLGDLLLNTGRWAEAEEFERSLLERYKTQLGSDSFYTWRTRLSLLEALNGLASTDPRYVQTALAESEEFLRLAKATHPIGHHYCRLLLSATSAMYLAKRDEHAVNLLNELDEFVKQIPNDLERTYFEGMSSYERGRLARRSDQLDVAVHHFEAAIKKFPAVFGEYHATIQDIRSEIQEIQRLRSEAGKAPIEKK